MRVNISSFVGGAAWAAQHGEPRNRDERGSGMPVPRHQAQRKHRRASGVRERAYMRACAASGHRASALGLLGKG